MGTESAGTTSKPLTSSLTFTKNTTDVKAEVTIISDDESDDLDKESSEFLDPHVQDLANNFTEEANVDVALGDFGVATSSKPTRTPDQIAQDLQDQEMSEPQKTTAMFDPVLVGILSGVAGVAVAIGIGVCIAAYFIAKGKSVSKVHPPGDSAPTEGPPEG